MDHQQVWARGKTAEEVLALTVQLDSTVQQLARQPQQPQVPPTQPQRVEFGDDEFVQGRQVKQLIEQFQHRGPDPYAQRAFQAASETAMSLLQQKPENKWIFDGHGPEVRALVSQMPVETKTLDNLQIAVDLIGSRHYRDLVASEAQRFAAENPTMRSTGGAGSGSRIPNPQSEQGVLENPAIPEDQRSRLKSLGLTEQQIRDFCQVNGHTIQEFVQLYAPPKGARALEVEPATTRRTA